MPRYLTVVIALMAASVSLAAVPAQSVSSQTAHTLQAQADINPNFDLFTTGRTQSQTEKSLTCQQRCDANYVRTHQICLAAISGLSSPKAPGSQDCDRAARAGIQQCQISCDANPVTKDHSLTRFDASERAHD